MVLPFRLVTPTQLRRILKQLGWSQMEAARQLGVAPRTVQYWVAGDYRIPEPVALLLRAWVAAADRDASS